jgi:hypothetical protein
VAAEDSALKSTGSHANVFRLYRATFRRERDISGARYWVQVYNDGATLNDIAYQFAFSVEFKLKYGSSLTDSEFHSTLNQEFVETHTYPAQN